MEELKTIKKALEAERVRQDEIQDQLEAVERQLRTSCVKRALMEAEEDSYITEQERVVSAGIKRLHAHLFNLNASLRGCSLAIEGLEAKLKEE